MKLEGAYEKSKYIQTIFVYGNSLKNILIVIIGFNKVNIFEFFKSNKNILALEIKKGLLMLRILINIWQIRI